MDRALRATHHLIRAMDCALRATHHLLRAMDQTGVQPVICKYPHLVNPDRTDHPATAAERTPNQTH